MNNDTRDRVEQAVNRQARSEERSRQREQRRAVRAFRRQAHDWGLRGRDLTITDIRTHPSYGEGDVAIDVEIAGHRFVASVKLVRDDGFLFDQTHAYYRDIRIAAGAQGYGRGVRTAEDFARLLDEADRAASQPAASALTSV